MTRSGGPQGGSRRRRSVGVGSRLPARLLLLSLVLLLCLAIIVPRVARGEQHAGDVAPAASHVEAPLDAADQTPVTDFVIDGSSSGRSARGAAADDATPPPLGEDIYEADTVVRDVAVETGVDTLQPEEEAPLEADAAVAADDEALDTAVAAQEEGTAAAPVVGEESRRTPSELAEQDERGAYRDATDAIPTDYVTECDDGTYSDAEMSNEGEAVVAGGAAVGDLVDTTPETAAPADAQQDEAVPLDAIAEAAILQHEEVSLVHEEAQSSFLENHAHDDVTEAAYETLDVPSPIEETEGEGFPSAADSAAMADEYITQREEAREAATPVDTEAPVAIEPLEDALPEEDAHVAPAAAQTAVSDVPPTPASHSAMVEPIAPHVYADVDRDEVVGDSDGDDRDDATTPDVADEPASFKEEDEAPPPRSEASDPLPPAATEEAVYDDADADADADAGDEGSADAPSTLSSIDPTAHTDVTEMPRPFTSPAPSPPSRDALSYLYYHALEALFIDENISLFVHRARDAAPYGHARLNWLLGVLHAYGVGVPQSERDALTYYSFAAMEGVPEAHMALGYRYRNGIGVQASCEAALAHYREAADAVAMTYDGSAADLEGRAVADTTGHRTLAGGAGGRSGLPSFFTYRDNVATSDRVRQVQQELLQLIYQADTGNGQALLTLGYIYLKGNQQVRRDGRRAEGFLKQAAAKGIAEAHGALGNLYTAGDATIDPPLPRDLQRAHHHYRLGAIQRDPVSLNGIGFLHAIGYLADDRVVAETEERNGGPQSSASPDFAAAARYFEQSRSPESTYNRAVLHLYGRGVPRDRSAAQRLFFHAAQGGSVLARWQLAHLLEESLESNPQECVKALELYKETASFGSWHKGDGAAATAALASRFSAAQTDTDDDIARGKSGAATASSSAASSQPGAARVDDLHDGPSAPRTSADYAHLLSAILQRLQAVEEGLRLSDRDDKAGFVSLASFVELLGLAETGDADSTWFAAQYVEDYLEAEGEAGEAGADAEGAVRLLWPAPPAVAGAADPAAFLAPSAARMSLFHYLLQRTVLHPRHKTRVHGDAYLRLGDLFYYGQVPQYGVDMARAMGYYRLAADSCHHPQALFNVGFMYQLGLHHAPRVTLVSAENFAAGRPEQPETIWKVHSNPPFYLTGSPSLYLVGKAAAHAWNRDSTNAMSRGVDVYLAWCYYTDSLEREGRGWMAVRAALLTLNVQWSLRHFGLASLFGSVASFPSGVPFPQGAPPPPPPPPEWAGQETEAGQALLETLSAVLHTEASFLYIVLTEVVASLATLFAQAEQLMLHGAVGVFTLAMLIRHHAV